MINLNLFEDVSSQMTNMNMDTKAILHVVEGICNKVRQNRWEWKDRGHIPTDNKVSREDCIVLYTREMLDGGSTILLTLCLQSKGDIEQPGRRSPQCGPHCLVCQYREDITLGAHR